MVDGEHPHGRRYCSQTLPFSKFSGLALASLHVQSGPGFLSIRSRSGRSGLAFACSLQSCCFSGLLCITLPSYRLSPLPRPLPFQFRRFLLASNLSSFLGGEHQFLFFSFSSS